MKKKYLLKCEAFQVYEGDMWFVSGNFLCRRNIKTGEINIESYIIPQYGVEGGFLCTLTGRYKNRMICIPEQADRLIDYDIKTKERRVFFLDNDQFDNSIKFRSSCFINDKFYIMPESAHKIMVYDPKLGEIDYLSDWFSILFKDSEKNIDNKENIFSLSRQIDNKIYFSTTFSNVLCCFDPQNNNVDYIHVGPADYKYQLFYYLDGIFYLVDNSKMRIVRWSQNEGIVGEKEGISFDTVLTEELVGREAEYRFFDAFNFGKVIFMPACFAKESLMIDTQTNQVEICNQLSEVYGCCYAVTNEANEAIITSIIDNNLFFVNNNLNVNKVNLELSEDVEKVGDMCWFDIMPAEKQRVTKNLWSESQEATLGNFIKNTVL